MSTSASKYTFDTAQALVFKYAAAVQKALDQLSVPTDAAERELIRKIVVTSTVSKISITVIVYQHLCRARCSQWRVNTRIFTCRGSY